MDIDGSVRHEVVVDLPVEEAFWKFADLDRIKPREHNMLAVPIEQTVLEQRVGGDVYDRGVDGEHLPLGSGPRVRATEHDRVQLGHRAELAGRLGPHPDERGRDHLRRRGRGAHPRHPIGRSGWNTLRMSGAIPDEELCEAVDESYRMVVGGLPKSVRPEGWDG